MSNSFSANPQKLKKCEADVNSVHGHLVSYNDAMADVLSNLNACSGYANIRRRIRDTCNGSREDADKMLRYLQALGQIADLYENTERRICDRASVEGVRWEKPASGSQYNSEGALQEDSWWEDFQEAWELFWNMLEQQIIDMPEWMRILLMTSPIPGMQPIGFLPYILENDYLRTAFWQAFAGDWTDDSNALGTLLSIVIGFIPYVGQLADLRDLIADIHNLIDDGPETSEWIALGFTVVGAIPGVGDLLKHGDELGDVVKHADDIADVVKHVEDFIGVASKKVDDFKKLFDEKVIKKIKNGLETKLPNNWADTLDNCADELKKVMDMKITEKVTLGDFMEEWGKERLQSVLEEIFEKDTETCTAGT